MGEREMEGCCWLGMLGWLVMEDHGRTVLKVEGLVRSKSLLKKTCQWGKALMKEYSSGLNGSLKIILIRMLQ